VPEVAATVRIVKELLETPCRSRRRRDDTDRAGVLELNEEKAPFARCRLS